MGVRGDDIRLQEVIRCLYLALAEVRTILELA